MVVSSWSRITVNYNVCTYLQNHHRPPLHRPASPQDARTQTSVISQNHSRPQLVDLSQIAVRNTFVSCTAVVWNKSASSRMHVTKQTKLLSSQVKNSKILVERITWSEAGSAILHKYDTSTTLATYLNHSKLWWAYHSLTVAEVPGSQTANVSCCRPDCILISLKITNLPFNINF